MSYSFVNTTNVVVDDNISGKIQEYLRMLKVSKVLIISGCIASLKIANEIKNNIIVSHDTVLFQGVTTNPNECLIYELLAVAKQFSPDVIVTIGGGSVHDSGKAVSVLLSNLESTRVSDYTVDGTLGISGIKHSIPIITVPTIVGSGSEVSPASLICIGNKKKVIFSTLLHPLAAILSPSIIGNAPKSILMRSAFDSFIQSIEGYISSSANMLSNMYALQAIELFIESYRDFKRGILNDVTTQKLCIASIFSSYVCSLSGVGAVHALSNPISGHYNLHHADALALVAPAVLKYNLRHTNADVTKLFNALSINQPISNSNSLCEAILTEITTIIDGLNLGVTCIIPTVNDGIIRILAEESFNQDMNGNPYAFSMDEIEQIFLKTFNK